MKLILTEAQTPFLTLTKPKDIYATAVSESSFQKDSSHRDRLSGILPKKAECCVAEALSSPIFAVQNGVGRPTAKGIPLVTQVSMQDSLTKTAILFASVFFLDACLYFYCFVVYWSPPFPLNRTISGDFLDAGLIQLHLAAAPTSYVPFTLSAIVGPHATNMQLSSWANPSYQGARVGAQKPVPHPANKSQSTDHKA